MLEAGTEFSKPVTTPHLRHLRSGEPPVHAPNAALLIDFDNVTLGIRSDLTKELKHLLNSDIIKGKVAVSRAYADWRRYHQYIVPLSESSIDLIFAPAFGNNKKNATDIRLAIDAMELVFTRPEIGTFILLSGDSDFSMLVIKLKEYGKYVIGVGIRESASDLLIQNCDEYYSYSDLAGLTKETEVPSTQKDPWILVKEAVEPAAAPAAPAERPPREDRGRRGRGRGRGRGREREERGETAAPAAEERHPEPKRHEGRREGRREERRDELTLARAFDLMRRALAELPSPVGHEALRLRMSALQGREDAMLDATRFPRLLRQAHDAEVADVRKVGEDEFEVVGRGVEPAPPPVRAAAATGEPAGDGVAAAAPVAPGEGARGGVRFRRGSRLPAAPPAIQMVGVVSLDEEPEPVRAPKGRKKGAKAAEPEGESGAKEAAPKKKAARPRGKKKVEG